MGTASPKTPDLPLSAELYSACRWYLGTRDEQAAEAVRQIGRSLAADMGMELIYGAWEELFGAGFKAEAHIAATLWVGICGWDYDPDFADPV